MDYTEFREKLCAVRTNHPCGENLRSDLREWAQALIEGYEPGDPGRILIDRLRSEAIGALRDPECPRASHPALKQDVVAFSKMRHLILAVERDHL